MNKEQNGQSFRYKNKHKVGKLEVDVECIDIDCVCIAYVCMCMCLWVCIEHLQCLNVLSFPFLLPFYFIDRVYECVLNVANFHITFRMKTNFNYFERVKKPIKAASE